jgi:5-formyltetrahydrofolate cyclo-ligase
VTEDEVDAARLAHFRGVAKRELRTRMRSVRAVLPQSAIATRSSAVCQRIEHLPEFARAQVILGFSAIRKEVDLSAVLTRAQALGKQTALPKVVGETLELRVSNTQYPLSEGSFGILEPPDDAPVVDPASVDLVLVPGLVFDASGHRIGYGRGHYDRLLPGLTNAFRVGVAYDFQLLAELPTEPHDIALHCVVTDTRCLRSEG